MHKILASQINLPILFTFNVRRSVYDTFGLCHFEVARKGLRCTLLPILTEQDSRIQQRANQLKGKIQRFIERNKTRIHLVSYCASGLDTRFALSQFNLGQHVPTLTTICTPHKGSRLAKLYDQKGLEEKAMYPIARAAGLGGKSFTELVPENIQSFNQVVPNISQTSYFSIGAEKTPQDCSEIYKKTCNMMRTLTKLNFPYQNDGVYGHDEVIWGKHLVNFQYDHSQVIGVGGGFRGQTFQLLREHLKYQQAVLKIQFSKTQEEKKQYASVQL